MGWSLYVVLAFTLRAIVLFLFLLLWALLRCNSPTLRESPGNS